MKKIIFVAALFFVTSAGILKAQTGTVSNTARQESQQARIAGGVENKELTRRETAKLEREQKKIQLEKKAVKADGTVTPKEKRFLKRQQNQASRDIYRQKHDDQERGLK
jgi:hypothetical protein